MQRNQRIPALRNERQKEYLYSKGVTNNEAYIQNLLEKKQGPYRPFFKATTSAITVLAANPVQVLGANIARADLLLQNKGANDIHLAFDNVPQINGASIKLVPDAVWGFSNNGITPNVSNLFAIADGADALLSINETIQVE